MLRRCNNPSDAAYKNYGGRGISVCPRWRSNGIGFFNFVADVGEKPSPEHSLDRKNNDGNYEPSNVKWSTIEEQQANRRCSYTSEAIKALERVREPKVTVHPLTGKAVKVVELAKEMGITYTNLWMRIKTAERYGKDRIAWRPKNN